MFCYGAGSTVENAKLLNKKLIFMLVRLIFALVEGTTDVNKILMKRANRFLQGERVALFDDHVKASGRSADSRLYVTRSELGC